MPLNRDLRVRFAAFMRQYNLHALYMGNCEMYVDLHDDIVMHCLYVRNHVRGFQIMWALNALVNKRVRNVLFVTVDETARLRAQSFATTIVQMVPSMRDDDDLVALVRHHLHIVTPTNIRNVFEAFPADISSLAHFDAVVLDNVSPLTIDRDPTLTPLRRCMQRAHRIRYAGHVAEPSAELAYINMLFANAHADLAHDVIVQNGEQHNGSV